MATEVDQIETSNENDTQQDVSEMRLHIADGTQLLDGSFLEHKDEIFTERIQAIKRELKEIRHGTHAEYIHALTQLELSRDMAVMRAELFRNYELECAERLFESEQANCLSEYSAEKDGLRDKMLQDISERKRKLREDRDNFDISNDATFESSKTNATRKAQRTVATRNEEQQKKNEYRRKPKVPVLPFQLKDHEIYDDLTILRRHTSGPPRKSGGSSTRKKF